MSTSYPALRRAAEIARRRNVERRKVAAAIIAAAINADDEQNATGEKS